MQFDPGTRRQERRQRQQQRVLDAHQRIVAGAAVHMVDCQPHRSEEEHRDLGVERRKAEGVDVQRAHRAHGTDEHTRHLLGVEDEEQHGGELQREDKGQQGREQVGATFELQLTFAAAADVPAPDDLHGERRTGRQTQHAEGRGEQQGNDGRLEQHA